MVRAKIVLLLSLSVVCLILSGMDMVKHKASSIQKLKNVMLVKITDQPDTSYTNVTFKDDKGKNYHLVIHDIYIEKERVFEGYPYTVEYRKQQILRPNNFIETID
jgi:hypothetical protein